MYVQLVEEKTALKTVLHNSKQNVSVAMANRTPLKMYPTAPGVMKYVITNV
jgi:hypothetical protein